MATTRDFLFLVQKQGACGKVWLVGIFRNLVSLPTSFLNTFLAGDMSLCRIFTLEIGDSWRIYKGVQSQV